MFIEYRIPMSEIIVVTSTDEHASVIKTLLNTTFIHVGKFKKNVTIHIFYPQALNLQYFLFTFTPQMCILILFNLLPNLKIIE